VVRVLERTTSRDVTVLHEQANRGRTVLEKFEDHADVASFAVVMLTPDDVGGAVSGKPMPRGRQNVVFELGFFFGKLGRERVCVLLAGGVEQPSDQQPVLRDIALSQCANTGTPSRVLVSARCRTGVEAMKVPALVHKQEPRTLVRQQVRVLPFRGLRG
jgi:hypothetical protein